HTRSKRDWSSDVCSSDLRGLFLLIIVLFAVGLLGAYTGIKIWGPQLSAPNQNSSSNNSNVSSSGEMDVVDQVYEMIEDNYVEDEIGRASCRESKKMSG